MTRNAFAVHAGDTIHVQPHDVLNVAAAPWPTHTDAIVKVTGVAEVGQVVVICWGSITSKCGSVVYDRDDQVELA